MYKVLIWGTGNLAKSFIANGYKCEIIGFIESYKTKESFKDKPVYSSTDILNVKYDFIVVASSHSNEIYSLCQEMHLDMLKVIFLYGIKKQVGFCNTSILKELLQEKNYTMYCSEFDLLEGTFIEEDCKRYQSLNERENFDVKEQYMYPIIGDKYADAGTMGNYFWQDLWAARLINKSGVKSHFDIGSRIDGFIAHLLAMGIDVSLIDVRKFPGEVENLHTIIDDATTLHQISDESIESMSALCSLEHFGLGRYGDPIDPEACFRCFENIQRKLKKGGRLYISVPVGRERVEFNAHRIFYASTLVECFSSMRLEEFSCVSNGEIEYNVDLRRYDNDVHKGANRYGLFYFRKI